METPTKKWVQSEYNSGKCLKIMLNEFKIIFLLNNRETKVFRFWNFEVFIAPLLVINRKADLFSDPFSNLQ